MSNKITLNKIDSLCKKNADIVFEYNVNDEKVLIKFSPFLSLLDEIALIDKVADTVVGDEYSPGLLDVVFFATYLQLSSNISIPTKKDPDDPDNKNLDLEKIYKWMCETQIISDIKQKITLSVYIEGLLEKVNQKIEFELKKKANQSPINDLISKINRIIDDFGETHDGNWGDILNSLSQKIEIIEEPITSL